MIGKSILHYKILEKLGEGGMGIVYLAEDTKLKRLVAIKFLPHHISANSDERKRFEIEAQAAAALNHPNIATIYAIEEADDELFIVMEYIKGKHLKDHLGSKPLAVDEAIDIAVQAAHGLQEAHNSGVVHRDIKSSNIMSDEKGRVKIMDFGLAKVGAGVQLTKELSTLGTAAYMSPEQAKGEEVDQRSDIWSFGVVFYEMLNGTMPFKGDYDQAILYSVLNEEPQAIENVPQPLVDIVMKCLQKDPQARYADCKALLDDLAQSGLVSGPVSVKLSGKTKKSSRTKIWAGAAALMVITVLSFLLLINRQEQKITSLAILPFTNSGGSEDTEYLSDGIPESIISYLQKIPDLKITSFNAVLRQYKKDVPDPRTVGEEMGVQSVAMGRISLRGDDISINIEIVDTRDNTVIMTQRFIEKLSNLYDIQSKVGKEITQKFQLEMSDNEFTQEQKVKAPDPLAYQNYLKGRFYLYKRTPNDLNKAVEYFEKAIEIDQQFALAYTGLADTYVLQYGYAGIAEYVIKPKIRNAAQKAMQLDSTLAEAHTSLAEYYRFIGKYSEAEKEFKKAIQLNPGYKQAYHWLALNYNGMGYYKKAIETCEKALQFDPHSPLISINLAVNYSRSGDSTKAFKVSKETIEQNPDYALPFFSYAGMLIRYNRDDEALEMALKGLANEPGSAYSYKRVGDIYRQAKKYDKAIEHYKKMTEIDVNFAFNENYYIGLTFSDQNEWETAYSYFKKAQQIDPLNVLADWRLADYYWHVYDYKQLVDIYGKLIRLREDDADDFSIAAIAHELFGDKKKALRYMTRSAELEDTWNSNLGIFYLHRGEIEKCISLLMPHGDLNSRFILCYAYLIKNQYKQAIEVFDKVLEIQNFSKRTEIYNRVFTADNYNRETIQVYFKGIFNAIGNGNILSDPLYKSFIYTAVGEMDSAFVHIYKGLEFTTPIWTYYLIMRSPAMKNLKSDPRYNELITRLKLKEYL